MTELPGLPTDLSVGEWLATTGPDSDIALCTRVRFARNLVGYRFSTLMDAGEARDLTAFLVQQVGQLRLPEPLRIIDITAQGPLERELLVERHLISRELAQAERPRAAAHDVAERIALMLNEEDHLRSQVFRSGFDVDAAYTAAQALDDALISTLPIAFSEEFGFLTSCPTNVGTGLRLSVMLHLPGLVWAEEMEKAANTCQKIHLAVRGLHGEGSRALGDFYQVSNQVTLGRSEASLVDDVRIAVGQLIAWERRVRAALLDGERRARTLDRVWRALGTLQSARILSSEECLNGLSSVRFGVQQGILHDFDLPALNRLLLLTQPAHLQKLQGRVLEPAERDTLRASLVRQVLSGRGQGA
ncbi:MAG: protein arginine kinase [Planctomycetota bacterium]